MIRKIVTVFFIGLVIPIVISSCRRDEQIQPATNNTGDTTQVFKPTPYSIEYPKGYLWPRLLANTTNPLTNEGVELGKKLFYDAILSASNTISCATCHKQEYAFTDNRRFSLGPNGEVGTRNSMPLFNLYGSELLPNSNTHRFMWDGSQPALETQVLAPIMNPIEMNQSLAELERELRAHPIYPTLFKKAFGIDSITIKYVAMAISQFERILISGQSKFDLYKQGLAQLNESETRGMLVFGSEEKGDCFHCHGDIHFNPFFTNYRMHNNGLDSVIKDSGLFIMTGNPADIGKFKTPSLRNLSFTAPYMHDGRFNTLEQVVEFYNTGVYRKGYTDEFMRKHPEGLKLTEQDKADLIAFLKTLDDYNFINNPKLNVR